MTATYWIALGIFIVWGALGLVMYSYVRWAEWDRDRRIARVSEVAYWRAVILAGKP